MQAGAAGRAGAPGGSVGSGGGAAGCSPCHLAVLKAECLPPASATCSEHLSSTTAADGTVTELQNFCFSDGTKDVEVVTYPPGVGTSSTRTVQILKDGALCSTSMSTTSRGADASGNSVSTTTEIITDPAGDLLATIVRVSKRISGGTSDTETITCAGQPPEPFVANCLYGPVFSCTEGTCM